MVTLAELEPVESVPKGFKVVEEGFQETVIVVAFVVLVKGDAEALEVRENLVLTKVREADMKRYIQEVYLPYVWEFGGQDCRGYGHIVYSKVGNLFPRDVCSKVEEEMVLQAPDDDRYPVRCPFRCRGRNVASAWVSNSESGVTTAVGKLKSQPTFGASSTLKVISKVWSDDHRNIVDCNIR
jgi:hypothetical protein